MNRTKSIAMICVFAAIPAVAFAQAPPAPATPPAATATTNCAPTRVVPQDGTIAPRGNSTTGQTSEPLSDKLAKSDGVLCPPPGVDPQIHENAPNTGSMQVIPPPGSPGGDPSIRPK